MTTPGFIHAGNPIVLGLIGDIEWGEWDVAVQRSAAFGVDGQSVIHGGLHGHPFRFPMMIWGFTSQASRDTFLTQLELNLGQVGDFQADTVDETVAYLPNVRFAEMKMGLGRADPWHLYYRQCFFTFEQLMPVPRV